MKKKCEAVLILFNLGNNFDFIKVSKIASVGSTDRENKLRTLWKDK